MGVDQPGTDFAAELARLKRRGSAVLVRDDGEGLGVCTDLLGSDEECRHRVLARAADSAVLPVPPTGATIVDVTPTDGRSSAAHGSTAFDRSAVARRVETAENVEAVASAVATAVERVAARGVEPGELRVCLGRLGPHVTREPVDTVADAVVQVLDLVRDRAGMAHAHLGHDVPEALEGVFDVTVETRTSADGLHQQRWHLHAADIDTGWLQMHAD